MYKYGNIDYDNNMFKTNRLSLDSFPIFLYL